MTVYAPRHDDARIALVHAGRAIVPVNESQARGRPELRSLLGIALAVALAAITSTQREPLGIVQPRF